ncbi:unnamed protein product [Spirodela intermedia]|uniref:Uncharacterized protein n=1 Tax=Spirodela intermedia TaxID=51605 RepID=A0ABN7ECV6_SPIIN|nr:unnamed protein product [Spirodela intermedia]CAA6675742.1 unnamed protein product [Spirodela intermedia]
MGKEGNVFKGTSKAKRTKLTDGSIRQPIGKLEDVIVRVNKYYLPIGFIIVDMKVTKNLCHVPITLVLNYKMKLNMINNITTKKLLEIMLILYPYKCKGRIDKYIPMDYEGIFLEYLGYSKAY